MILLKKISCILTFSLTLWACNNKVPEATAEKNETESAPKQTSISQKNSIEGVYTTQTDPDYSGDCKISVEILKTKNGYSYVFKTKSKNLKGAAEFTSDESGEKYLVLKGIKWDYYEGDISNEDDADSIAGSDQELETPVDIDASYVQDTITIQNYGNAMNSYTKIEECDRKYIRLIRK